MGKHRVSYILTERLSFVMEHCAINNVQVARACGIDSSTFSKIRQGKRHLLPDCTQSMQLCMGIFWACRQAGSLPCLYRLLNAEHSANIPDLLYTLLCWLAGGNNSAARPAIPFHQQDFVAKAVCSSGPKMADEEKTSLPRLSLASVLDDLMNELKLSNLSMAAEVHLDASEFSRLRRGNRRLVSSDRLLEQLAGAFVRQAEKGNRLYFLVDYLQQNAVPEAELNSEKMSPTADTNERLKIFFQQLVDAEERQHALHFFRFLERFPEISSIPKQYKQKLFKLVASPDQSENFKGLGGIREAVLRFFLRLLFCDEVKEISLYSNQPSAWMTEDQEYYRLVGALMFACIRFGHKIRVIHYLRREKLEMSLLLLTWFPLHMSGNVESYFFDDCSDQYFYNTCAVLPEICAFEAHCVRGSEAATSCSYITNNSERIAELSEQFDHLLTLTQPLAHVQLLNGNHELHPFLVRTIEDRSACNKTSESCVFYQPGLPLGFMPEGLLERILNRQGCTDAQREAVHQYACEQQAFFDEILSRRPLMILSRVSSTEAVSRGGERLNYPDTMGLPELFYQPDEYQALMKYLAELTNSGLGIIWRSLNERRFMSAWFVSMPDFTILFCSRTDRSCVRIYEHPELCSTLYRLLLTFGSTAPRSTSGD